MVNDPLNKQPVAGDVFIREDVSRGWDADVNVFDNVTADPFPLDVGYPFKAAGVPATTAELATAAATPPGLMVGFLLNSVNTPAGVKEQIVLLARGTGVVVDLDNLPKVDFSDNAFDVDDFNAVLLSLGFMTRNEPATMGGPQVN